MNSNGGGSGTLGVLQILFIVLKLTGLIDWTWVQVFIPTFISIGLAALIIIVTVTITIIDHIKYHSNR